MAQPSIGARRPSEGRREAPLIRYYDQHGPSAPEALEKKDLVISEKRQKKIASYVEGKKNRRVVERNWHKHHTKHLRN